MIFIYINTDCESVDWWVKYFLKNGTYSCLLILFWYNFCYDILLVRLSSKATKRNLQWGDIDFDLGDDDYDDSNDNNISGQLGEAFCANYFLHTDKDTINWEKGCGMAFSIIFGISNIIFSYAFKDIIICLMNILIYYGMGKFYFNSGIDTNSKDYNKNGDGAIDFIILICSVLLLIYFIIEKIKDMKSSNVNAIVNSQGNVNEKPNVNTEIQTLKNQILNIANVQNQTIMKVNANSEQINLITHKMNITSRP